MNIHSSHLNISVGLVSRCAPFATQAAGVSFVKTRSVAQHTYIFYKCTVQTMNVHVVAAIHVM